MAKRYAVILSWALAVGTFLVLPCCLAWQVDLNPGTTYLDHLPTAISLLVAGLLLLIVPSPGTGRHKGVPDEHIDVFRYAIRSGELPIASLFGDWSADLAGLRSLLKVVLRSLPIGTGAVVAMDLYGILVDPQGRVFFLVAALAAMVFGVAAFSMSTVRLQNISAVEDQLRIQTQFLETQPEFF